MAPSSHRTDIAVVGAGFAGCLMALLCRKMGRSVTLIEKGRHPRFAIGESTTPLTNLLLEEIGQDYSIDFLSEFSTWGAWQERHADLPVGLKRGFTFFHHTEGQAFRRFPDHRNELLVAASPSDAVGDTHWYRESFDAFLLRQAIDAGSVYLDETCLSAIQDSSGDLCLIGSRKGQQIEVNAKFVIDASGPRGALFRLLNLGEWRLAGMPLTRSVYGHFRDVKRCAEQPAFDSEGVPPYPVDDAAVHHLFPGGWFWALRFNNAITSAGVVADADWGAWSAGGSIEAIWKRALDQFPTLSEQFQNATSVGEMRSIERVPFCVSEVSSSRFALLPSAIASIDPLFSTGFPLALLGVLRLAGIIWDSWGKENLGARMEDYARVSLDEADRVARLVGLAYRTMGRPVLFNALSSIYFACVSFEETQRRLGKGSREASFLLGDKPRYRKRIDECLENLEVLLRVPSPSPQQELNWVHRVRDCIEPFNVIGIGSEEKGNWYPVELEDLFAGCEKLSASPFEIQAMLNRLGLAT